MLGRVPPWIEPTVTTHGIERVVLPADDGLQVENDAGGEDDRVDGGVRRGAVAAFALDDDVDGIDVDERQALGVADLAMREARIAVQAEAEIGAREALEQAVREHHAGAGADFLRGLADEDERAAPVLLEARQHPGGADPAGHVHIVAAGVHDADFVAVFIARADFAGVGNAGFFHDRQGVHVGANEDGRADAVFQDADDAVPADFFGDFEAERFQFLGEAGGRFFFFEGELGIAVQLLVQSVEALELGVDDAIDERLAGRQIVGEFFARLGLQRTAGRQHCRHDRQHPRF